MKNYLQLQRSSSFLFKFAVLFAFICSLPFVGSDCDDGIIGSGITGDIVGTWQLTSVTGNLQDICKGEVVKYDSTGIAVLQCPNSSPITRHYTVSNSILTYTETGVQYDITTLSNTTLVLVGRNNLGRTLSYTRMPADAFNSAGPKGPNADKNSSEL